MIGVHDDVDRFVLHLDFRISQHAAQGCHVERPVHPRQRRESGGADEFAVVLELPLQGLLHLGRIEACQNIDDMQPGDRVLTLDPGDQIVDGRFVGDLTDDLEQSAPFAGFLVVRGVQEFAHREAGLLRGYDIENGLFGHGRLAQGIEQRARRIVLA